MSQHAGADKSEEVHMKENYAMVNRITFSRFDNIRLAASAGVLEGGRGAVDLKLIVPI